MNLQKLISHLVELGVTHEIEVENSREIHYFYRVLPEVDLGGHTVVGHVEASDGEKAVPEKETEALYRRLWLFQEYPRD